MEKIDIIKTVLLENYPDVLKSLTEELALYSEIKLVGCGESFCDSKQLIEDTNPDLVFFDLEIEGKKGFELLNEWKASGQSGYGIIVITNYDKFVINEIKKNGFIYLIKPINSLAIKEAIDRFKKQSKPPKINNFLPTINSDTIALPSAKGLQFIHKKNIVMIQSSKECSCERKCWEVVLHDFEIIKLKSETCLKDIFELLGKETFIQINQSCILNILFLGAFEFKTRECILHPPFADLKLTVSRNNMLELRGRFDIL